MIKSMKILLTGGSGLLGTELLKLNPNIISPSHADFDVMNGEEVVHDITFFYKPELIIHCAAILDVKTLENHPAKAIETNIIGTANLAIACIRNNIRLVFISTDYIYPGTEGNYKETDPILPYNFYASTKLGGECAVQGVKNHLIIRTSFGPSKFPYKQAFRDVWRSKDYVDVIAPMIYEAATSELTGVLNIGTDRKTMYSYAKERNNEVEPVLVADSGFDAPWDTSFNLDRWNNYKKQHGII
jgi:dTDP-4-dehydrorhamnose reductase